MAANSFATAAAALNIKGEDAVRAEQMWSMLDELAASDPAAYKAFLDKQKREYEALQEQNKPPQPVFTVATHDVGSPVAISSYLW